MASLEKLANLMNIELPKQEEKEPKKVAGTRRRSWLSPENDKGSIDTVHQHGSSTVSIDKVYQPDLSTRSMNQVDEQVLDKGLINPIDKLGLSDLRGNPLNLIKFLYQISYAEEGRISRKTTLSEIMLNLGISRDSARTALRFSLKNNLLARVINKVGKNGWSQYLINNNLFNEIEEAVKNGRLELFSHNKNYSDHKGFNSSSSNIKSTTTELDEWKNIDCTPLAEIGFRAEHLRQLKDKISPGLVTESIEHFAWGLRNKGISSTCTSKLGAFISALKRGTPWTEPALLEQDNLVIQAMLEAKERKEKERGEQIEQLFADWDNALTDEQKRSYESGKFTNEPARRAERKEYFIKNVLKK